MSGTLYGLGVGPGDPELLTLKAYRLLKAASVVAYPAPDTGPSFARSIVAEFMREDQTEIPIIVPMRSERFPAQSVYDEAAATIAEHLSQGQDVVVLCEGDAFFYGSFMYLFERLAPRFNCEVVPGVSSLMATAASCGRPLAARNDILTVIPAPSADKDIENALSTSHAIAFIKVGRHLPRIYTHLENAGLLQKAWYVERATLENQKIMPLSEHNGDAPYFSMVLVYHGSEKWIGDLPVVGDTA